jgi:hypothetical protein
MGSVPSQLVEADVNGTGTLVDITAYVDFQVGIKHSWGRTAGDPFRAEPPPGSLTMTLDNNDGRFTPGNTATYLVGLVEGVLVQWTCGSRVRRFRTGVPELSFPTGVGGRATVTVTCLDALALLAKREMRQMVDEVAFAEQPQAYWPLNESGSGSEVRAMDISGYAETPLYVTGAATDLVSWAGGIGPRTDGRAALMFQPDATAPAASGAGESPVLGLVKPLGTSGHEIDWYQYTADLNPTFGNQWGYALSFWFSVRDIYGATYTAADLDDGPYVFLASIGPVTVCWRTADRKLILNLNSNIAAQPSLPAVQPGTVHHVFAWVHGADATAPGGPYSEMRVWLDGVEGDNMVSTSTPTVPPSLTLAGGGGITSGGWANYGLSGTLACVSVYTTAQAAALEAAGALEDFYPVGASGPEEDAGTRYQRYGEWLGRSEIDFAVEGDPQAVTLGSHNTEGKSMLKAMCDALAMEERVLDCATVAGVETVRAWMESEHRPATAAVTVNVDSDGQGTPTLTFDASGVAVTVAVRGAERTVTWTDIAAPDRWKGTSTSIDAATEDVDALRSLAQFRSLLGRVTSMALSKVTVDAVTSTASLTTSLLALRPMVRVSIAGLPTGVVGYTSVDEILVGAVERHRQGRSTFELQLTPDLPYVEAVEGLSRVGGIPAPYSYSTPAAWAPGHPITGEFPRISAMNNSQTTMTLQIIGDGNGASGWPASLYFFATGALPDPVYVELDDEVIRVDSAGSVSFSTVSYSTPSYAWIGEQTLTVTRAQQSTSAAAHSQSGGGIFVSGGGTTMITEAYTAPREVWQHMFDCVAF